MKDIIVLKGQVVYAESPERLAVRPDACLVAEDGKVTGVYVLSFKYSITETIF